MQMATIGGGSATFLPGRGVLRPNALPSPALKPPAGELPERDLPLPIQRACTRIQFWRAGPFVLLSTRDRAVLAEVVRCVDRKLPSKPVYVRRDTLADREGCSVPTITRALSRLADLGWIVRDQVKSRSRGFQVGSVELTAEAVAWLGLLDPSPTLRESTVIDASRSSGIQCIHRQPPAGGIEDKPFSKTKPGEVPASLAWLERLHVSRNGVFLLMKLARKRGVLLEDVALLCRSQIEAARTPFAYLRDLLARDKDWAYVAQAAKADAEVARGAEARDAAQKELQRRLEGVGSGWWLAAGKRQLVRLECGVFMVFALGDDGQPGASLGARPDVEVVLDAIDAGRLVRW